MSLTVDGWSWSIWPVQHWTGMMNTASSVNGCHQSSVATVHPDSSLPQVGLPGEGPFQNAGQSAAAKANISFQYIEHYNTLQPEIKSTLREREKERESKREMERECDRKRLRKRKRDEEKVNQPALMWTWGGWCRFICAQLVTGWFVA